MFDVNDNFTKRILISMGFCSHTTHYCVALHTVRHPTESLLWLPVIYEQNGIHFKFNWYFDNQKECVGPTGSRSRWYRHHTTMSFHENVSVNSFYFSPFFTLIKLTRRKKKHNEFCLKNYMHCTLYHACFAFAFLNGAIIDATKWSTLECALVHSTLLFTVRSIIKCIFSTCVTVHIEPHELSQELKCLLRAAWTFKRISLTVYYVGSISNFISSPVFMPILFTMITFS